MGAPAAARLVIRIVAYVPDLMDRSKVAAALAGQEVVFAADPVELGPPADLVIVDLGRPGVLEVLPALKRAGLRTVGFVSHVDRERADAAAAAGCGEVMPRSRFFAQLATLVP